MNTRTCIVAGFILAMLALIAPLGVAHAATPSISTISPISVPIDQGYDATKVTVTGSNFAADTVIYIPATGDGMYMTANGSKITPDSWNPTTIVFHAPTNRAVGAFAVYATKGDGSQALSGGAQIQLTTSATPSVTMTITPSTIPNGGTYTVSWTSVGVTACAGTGLLGSEAYLPANGSITRTYNFFPGSYPLGLSCQLPNGAGFGAGAQGTLVVTGPTIDVNLTTVATDPMFGTPMVSIGTGAPINPNFSITWNAHNAASCTAIGGTFTDYMTQQQASIPGWSGDIGLSGTRSLSVPFTKALVSSPISIGVRCRDTNGTVSEHSEPLAVKWVEGKPKTVTMTAPVTGATLTYANPLTISWNTTNLPSSLTGYITLTPSSGVAAGGTIYYLAHDVPNTGSYVWNGKDNYNRTNTYWCAQNGPDSSCFTLSTNTIPNGTYQLALMLFGDPNSLYDVNALGQQIVDGKPSNIISKVSFWNQPPAIVGMGGAPVLPPPAPVSGPAGTTGTPPGAPTSTPGTPSAFTTPTTSAPAASNVGTLSGETGSFTPSPAAQSLIDQIAALQAQLQALLAQQGGIPAPAEGTKSGTTNGGVSATFVNISHALMYGVRDGSTEGDVSELQTFLRSKGYLSSEPTGFYGSMTRNAVREFQAANGIPQTGTVGPLTRAKINGQ